MKELLLLSMSEEEMEGELVVLMGEMMELVLRLVSSMEL